MKKRLLFGISVIVFSLFFFFVKPTDNFVSANPCCDCVFSGESWQVVAGGPVCGCGGSQYCACTSQGDVWCTNGNCPTGDCEPDCVSYQGDSCGTNTGICSSGTYNCAGSCSGAYSGYNENGQSSCSDGQDNDCDGYTDCYDTGSGSNGCGAECGCMDPDATNYEASATISWGTCTFPEVYGCTDPNADNYNSDATSDDGSCEYSGCTSPDACNYDSEATNDDGSCYFEGQEDLIYRGCDGSCINNNINPSNELCDEEEILGCTDEDAINYNPDATTNDGSCYYYNDCYFTNLGSCMNDDLAVFKASGNAAALVSLIDYGSYDYTLCCDIDASISDSVGSPFILLSNEINALVQNPSYEEYLFGVGFSEDFTCETTADECSQTEFCVFEYASNEGFDTEAKVAECGSNYAWNVCCTGMEDPILGCTITSACNYNPFLGATHNDGSCDFGFECCSIYGEVQTVCSQEACDLIDINSDGICEDFAPVSCTLGIFEPDVEDCDPYTASGERCELDFGENYFCEVDDSNQCGHCYVGKVPWELNNCQNTFAVSSSCLQCEEGEYCEYGGQKSVEWYTYTYQQGCSEGGQVNTDDCLSNLDQESCDNYWNEQRDCYFSLEEDVPFFDSISIIFSLMVLISYYFFSNRRLKF